MKDLTGQKFGKLTVVRLDDDEEYFTGRGGKRQKKIRWICQCECGKMTKSFIQGLSSGHATQCKTCGYYRPQTSSKMIQQLFGNIKYNAKNRQIDFKVTAEFLQNLFNKQEERCAVSGLPITFGKTRKEHNHGATTASLDRIDSSRGYTEDNVQWVHKKVNFMKLDMSQQEFVKLCDVISLHNKAQKDTP